MHLNSVEFFLLLEFTWIHSITTKFSMVTDFLLFLKFEEEIYFIGWICYPSNFKMNCARHSSFKSTTLEQVILCGTFWSWSGLGNSPEIARTTIGVRWGPSGPSLWRHSLLYIPSLLWHIKMEKKGKERKNIMKQGP